MSQTIKLKRGTTTPTTSNIVSGEVAIDTSAKKLYVNDAGTIKEIGGLGTLSASDIPNLPASKITSGTLSTARIPNLAASKITSGTLADARIPSLAASKITSGTFATARIPSLDASKITSGTLGTGRIPNLAASKITSGTLADARIPNLNASKITAGTLSASRIPEFLEEKYIFNSNDSNGVFMPMVKGGMYATSSSSVTGAIKVVLPAYKSNMMFTIYVDIFEYTTGETCTFRVSGYAYNDSGATWHSCSVVAITDNNRDYTVRFYSDTANSQQYFTIGETNSTWSYPQVTLRDFWGGYSTSESEAQGTWNISFVTSFSGTLRHTFSDNLPYADWDRLEGKPSFATVATSGSYNDLSNKPTIPTSLPANGGNSDTVDNLHASSFLRSDANDTATGLVTFSGGINGFTLANGISGSNFNITGVNQLSINDPGEGISFGGGANTVTLAAIDDANDNIMNFNGAAQVQVNGRRVFESNYHPNADKWTTGRSHTVTLTGDVTGTATQTVDGSANKTWSITTTVANNSHDHTNYVGKTGDTMTGQLTMSGTSPQIKFNDTTSGADDFWIHVNSDQFYVLTDRDDNGSWDGTYPLQLKNSDSTGHLYGQRLFAENYHPNADKLTTARTIAGTSFDGTANINISYNNLTNKPSIPAAANNATITITAGASLTGGGNFTTNQGSNETITINHQDTSSQGSVNNSGNTVIQDVTLDTNGHVTGLTSKALSIPAAANNATITLTAGTGLSGGGNFTTNQSSAETLTFNLTTPTDAPSSWQDVVGWNGALIKDTAVEIHGSGYLRAAYLNMTHGVGTRSSDTIFYSSNDDYIRKTNAAGMRSALDIYTKGEVDGLIPSTSNLVTTNTAQTISGAKTFTSNVGVSGNISANFYAFNGSYVNATADVRAPIFYDRNNTSYYVHADSESVLNAVRGHHFRVSTGDGKGIRFWNSDSYKIYMSATSNSTYGGRAPYESTSDYNMYFRMAGGTNRGFVFRSDTTNVAGIDSSGNFNTSGIIKTGNGAASAPAYAFTGDYDSGMFSLGSNAVGFSTGGTQRFKVNSNGLLLTGSSSLWVNGQQTITSTRDISNVVNYQNTDGHMQLHRTGNAPLIINRKGTTGSTGTSRGEILNFKSAGSKVGRIAYYQPYGSNFVIAQGNTSGHGLGFYQFSTSFQINPVNIDGTGKDNAVDIGNSYTRFDDVYATNGTIQTSDRNEKQDIQELTDAETRAAVTCKGLMRRFRWIDSVTEKGDDARYHFGAIAQDVEAAFTAEGLDASDYGLFIRTTWWEHEGHSYPSADVAPEGAVEKTRLGIRYNQLFAFIIGAL